MEPDPFDLTGCCALVAESSYGGGLALAHGLAKTGAMVRPNGRDSKRIRVFAKQIVGNGVLACDVTDQAAACAAVDTEGETGGPIDILISNAGG